jgi:hypothetical protein
MERKEDSYVKGERVQYRENTAVLIAEVIANNCSQGTIDYHLKIIKTIIPHDILGGFREGAEFRFTNSSFYGGVLGGGFGLGKIIGNAEEEISR